MLYWKFRAFLESEILALQRQILDAHAKLDIYQDVLNHSFECEILKEQAARDSKTPSTPAPSVKGEQP